MGDRVIVAGGRKFNNYFFLAKHLDLLLEPDDFIIEGGANGVDRLASWYTEFNNMGGQRVNADWDRYGPAAGYVRNKRMAQMATKLVAFWDGKSKGTKNMIDTAHKLGLPTTTVLYADKHYLRHDPNMVKNVSSKEPFDIYIGRSHKECPNIWANPIYLNSNKSRLYTISKFAHYLMNDNASPLWCIAELVDKKLGCHCSPLICHGDLYRWILTTDLDGPNYRNGKPKFNNPEAPYLENSF